MLEITKHYATGDSSYTLYSDETVRFYSDGAFVIAKERLFTQSYLVPFEGRLEIGFAPEPKPTSPQVGDTTVVDRWDGTRWVEVKLVWKGQAYQEPVEAR